MQKISPSLIISFANLFVNIKHHTNKSKLNSIYCSLPAVFAIHVAFLLSAQQFTHSSRYVNKNMLQSGVRLKMKGGLLWLNTSFINQIKYTIFEKCSTQVQSNMPQKLLFCKKETENTLNTHSAALSATLMHLVLHLQIADLREKG